MSLWKDLFSSDFSWSFGHFCFLYAQSREGPKKLLRQWRMKHVVHKTVSTFFSLVDFPPWKPWGRWFISFILCIYLLRNWILNTLTLFYHFFNSRGILKAAQTLLKEQGMAGQKFYWLASDGWGKQSQVVKAIEDFAVGAITVELESKKISGKHFLFL